MKQRVIQHPHGRRLVALAGVVTLSSIAAGQHAQYRVTDLGTVPGSHSCECYFGRGINASGQGAVQFFGTDGVYAAAFHDGVTGVDIGSLGGDATFPHAINDHGAIVGFSDTAGEPALAFVWQDDVMTGLGTLADRNGGGPQGAVHSNGRDINNAGQVVGSTHDQHGNTRPFLWSAADDMIDLGTFGGEFGNALGINEAGTVVGWAWNPSRDRRPFIWTASGGMIDLGTLTDATDGKGTGEALDVNSLGQVVGQSETGNLASGAPERRAVLWNAAGDPINLGTLPPTDVPGIFGMDELINSVAVAINDAGQVLGNAFPASVASGAFIYENGSMAALTDLLVDADAGWIIHEADDINNAGQIIATARFNGGDSRAVILTPVGDACAADLTGDGAADVFDLLAYLDLWFTLDASAERTGDSPASIDVFDLLVYLDDWFAGC